MDTFRASGTIMVSHNIRTPTQSPVKGRSLSDSTPVLSPSPNIHEASRRESKDDHAIPSALPKTPRRPDLLSRGLSLQMPPRDMSMPSPANIVNRVPLSPQLDAHDTYGSPATSLPRHSRGMDFSRACTNLHHSTIAEQSSPDSSPTITQKGIMIPSRKASMNSMMLDSPNLGSTVAWPALPNMDRTGVSSSVGSVNMLGSESGSSDSDVDDLMDPGDNDDPTVTTPQVFKLHNNSAPTPYSRAQDSSYGGGPWSGSFSPAQASLMNIQRVRLRKGRSRKSSSSASGHSSMASPNTMSSPPVRSIEGANGSYFARELAMRNGSSRRESLAMGTHELHISSSGNDSGDEAGTTAPSTPGVVRRAVTRRGNLLPKTKGFARIRAALMEESTPIDSEVRREAETIRQVRERESDVDRSIISTTANSSPGLPPTIPGPPDSLEDIPEDSLMSLDNSTSSGSGSRSLVASFTRQASRHSGGLDFWNRLDKDLRTPPPPSFLRGASSGGVSTKDVNMDYPHPSYNATPPLLSRHSSSTTNPQPNDMSASRSSHSSTPLPTPAEITRKVTKRRRDDDFDIASFKRRAVSPSLSIHNSPVLTQSPSQRGADANAGTSSSSSSSLWGPPPKAGRENSSGGAGERAASGSGCGSVGAGLGMKRVGLQGMVDTNDGLMKMSIE
ncbi:hypothetical protein LTR04_006785 [Oleoguttula sp. CCFEE 6159]|nr:hypothetical protein LTR04_006785 [Oleoguttula sp. CCFEE 6159]